MSDSSQNHRFTAVLREEERVTPLELFFDLVFVLAITQCTALMANTGGWKGIGEGLLTLGLLWWAWVGYAWLTSVVNPEEGFVRFAMFGSMAALLVVALCVPEEFHYEGMTFAVAYTIVRVAQIALFVTASGNDSNLRSQVIGLGISTAIGAVLLIGGAFLEGEARYALWALALTLDAAGPYVSRADGWKLMPEHFAERHGLIIIIALGESIVAVGAGAGTSVTTGVIAASVIGIGLAAAMWWAYFDVVALVAARVLHDQPVGKEQNEMARDSYSYLHFPMIVGTVLVALGMKKTLAHVDDPLKPEIVFALVGGTACYLLGHVAFRWRNVHSINKQRLVVAAFLLISVPVIATIDPPALAVAGFVTAVIWLMIAYEAIRFSEGRARVRHELASEPPSD